MELMLNELSFEGHNPDSELREAIRKIMDMRSAVKSSVAVEEVYCHWNINRVEVRPGESLREKLNQVLSADKRRAFFRWIDKAVVSEDYSVGGSHKHNGNDVTQTGLGHAAHSVKIGNDGSDGWRMVSLARASWERSSIVVTYHENDAATDNIPLDNYWNKTELEQALEKATPEPKTWKDVEEYCRRRFTSLTFTPDCFAEPSRLRLSNAANKRIRVLLSILNRICARPNSPEGIKLVADHFGGKKALFSNSSESERNAKSSGRFNFRLNGGTVDAFWHGKINNPPYRIHFTWPICDGKVYVVYVGRHR